MRRLDEDEQCCGCAALDSDEDYNLGLHVGAIFILFAVSAAGAVLPAVAQHVPFLSSRSIVVEWLMAFGYGVVLATGFIHMINEGAEMLRNPCLGEVVENYESLGLAIVLATVVLMHLIECESTVFFSKRDAPLLHGHAHGPAVSVVIHNDASDHTSSDQTAPAVTTPTQEADGDVVSFKALASDGRGNETTLQKQLAVMLFELGVIFHSVIIGIDLGVTAGFEFKTLLAAICFHQFFEGVAIGGSALAALGSMKSVMAMNFAYAATTPLGLAIGIAIRSTYSATSVTSLWVQGVLNCMAGGILLYTGLVQLMTYEMTTNREFLGRTGKQRLVLYVAFWLGAGLMALIGKWA